MPDRRRYDEDEVSELLARAAELQRRRAGNTRGLTLEEIERIAAESGLDPAAVREAARERSAPRPPASNAFGGPFRLAFREEVSGPVAEADVDRILDLVDQSLGLEGRRSRAGREWTWRSAGTTRRVKVGVQLRDGGATVTAEEDLVGLAGGLWGGLFGGTAGAIVGVSLGFGLGAFGSLTLALGLLGAGLAGSFLVTRAMAMRQVRARWARLRDLAEDLALALPARSGESEGVAERAPETVPDRLAPRTGARAADGAGAERPARRRRSRAKED